MCMCVCVCPYVVTCAHVCISTLTHLKRRVAKRSLSGLGVSPQKLLESSFSFRSRSARIPPRPLAAASAIAAVRLARPFAPHLLAPARASVLEPPPRFAPPPFSWPLICFLHLLLLRLRFLVLVFVIFILGLLLPEPPRLLHPPGGCGNDGRGWGSRKGSEGRPVAAAPSRSACARARPPFSPP